MFEGPVHDYLSASCTKTRRLERSRRSSTWAPPTQPGGAAVVLKLGTRGTRYGSRFERRIYRLWTTRRADDRLATGPRQQRRRAAHAEPGRAGCLGPIERWASYEDGKTVPYAVRARSNCTVDTLGAEVRGRHRRRRGRDSAARQSAAAIDLRVWARADGAVGSTREQTMCASSSPGISSAPRDNPWTERTRSSRRCSVPRLNERRTRNDKAQHRGGVSRLRRIDHSQNFENTFFNVGRRVRVGSSATPRADQASCGDAASVRRVATQRLAQA